jgi:DNA-binding transcriptional MerR regulator
MPLTEPAAQKLFYKIGEVCEMVGVEPYTLRYWEKEFPFLAPQKNSAGQRIYSSDDLRLVERIKTLLYREGYTIEGARRQIEREERPGGAERFADEAAALREENRRLKAAVDSLRRELRALATELRRGADGTA